MFAVDVAAINDAAAWHGQPWRCGFHRSENRYVLWALAGLLLLILPMVPRLTDCRGRSGSRSVSRSVHLSVGRVAVCPPNCLAHHRAVAFVGGEITFLSSTAGNPAREPAIGPCHDRFCAGLRSFGGLAESDAADDGLRGTDLRQPRDPARPSPKRCGRRRPDRRDRRDVCPVLVRGPPSWVQHWPGREH